MIETLIKNPIINQLHSYFAVLDFDSNFMFLNQTSLKLTGFNSIDSGIGMPYMNMPCKAAEQYQSFILEDTLAQKNEGAPLKILGYLCFANDNWKIMMGEKSVLKDEAGKPFAIVSHFYDITHHDIAGKLFRIGLGYKSIPVHDQPIYILSSHHSDLLTNRQAECLFYLIRGKTAKEIAKILKVSPRTIDNHLAEIKIKFNCHTKSQLIEKAITDGYSNFIPPGIFEYHH